MSDATSVGAHDGALMRSEMREQPAVLRALVARWERDVDLIRESLPDPLRGVAFVGRGSSDNVATIGRYAVERFAGVPVALAAPSLSTRYSPPLTYDDHLIVAMSQSGGTPEIVSAGQALRGAGSRLLAITNDGSSELAGVADATYLLGAGEERAVPATKTVSAQVLAVLAVAAAIAAVAGRSAPVTADELSSLPDAVEAVLGDVTPVRTLVERWRAADRLQVIGRGLVHGAVLEVGLKVRETAGVFAQGISAADLVHGPIAAMDPSVPAMIIDGGGPNAEELAAVGERLRSIGVDVATMGAGEGSTLSLPEGLPEILACVPIIVRGQQMAEEWALILGLDPDRPAGLSKMTLTY